LKPQNLKEKAKKPKALKPNLPQSKKAKTPLDPKMCKEGDKLTCWVLESKKTSRMRNETCARVCNE
jgi:hypothetical protein